MKIRYTAMMLASAFMLQTTGCDFFYVEPEELKEPEPMITEQPFIEQQPENESGEDTESPENTESDGTAENSGIQEETTEEETEEAAEKPDASVSFMAVGDNLIHDDVYFTAAAHAENGEEYNFDYCYQYMMDEIEAADVAFINQETIIAPGFELSGSNLNFNSPEAVGDEIVDLGFDIINMANNHLLDRWEDGLSAALDYWDEKREENPELVVMGAYHDEDDMNDYRIFESNGITIGCLAYTEHTNGYLLSEDSDLKICYLEEEDLIEKQIKELKEQVDCVLVSAHWGIEDTHIVSESMQYLAQEFVDWGADIIIGTGPHTLESMEYIEREDGTKGFVYYSLGNFISAQTDNFNLVGGMAKFNIKRENGEITIDNPRLTPVITQYDSFLNIRTYPYYLYTDELIAEHSVPYMGSWNPWWSRDIIDGIINDNVPKEFQQLKKEKF